MPTYKTLVSALLCALYAILFASSLEGGGVMRNLAIRGAMVGASGVIPSPLPVGFSELSFIDSNYGGQGSTSSSYGKSAAYIDTELSGLKGSTTIIEIEAVSKFDSNVRTQTGEWNLLFAAQNTDLDSGTIQIRRNSSSNPAQVSGNKLYSNGLTLTTGESYKLKLDGTEGRLYCGDNYISAPAMTSNALHSLCVFHSGNGTWLRQSERFWKGMVGRMKVWSNGTLVADYYPAKRDSDGICGYYDVIRQRFDTSKTAVPILGIA